MLSTEARKKIIDDLLIKRPVGPSGNNTYTSSVRYCYEKYKDVTDYKCNKDFYGYDPLTLFKVGLHTQSQIERYVLNRFYGGSETYELTSGQKGGVSRKSNRLYERLNDAVRHIQRHGATGVYEVSQGYYGRNSLGFVHADSSEDALCKAKLLFSYVADGESDIRVGFLGLGDASELARKTAEYVKSQKNRIASLEDEIKRTKEKIESHKARIQAASLVQLHEIANQDVPGVQT